VCAGAVGTQAPILAHDLRSIRLASPAAKNFCTTIFGLCPLPNTIPHAVNLTAAPLDADHPSALEALAQGRTPHVKKRWVSKGRKPFQIVHISDVHVDRSYAVRPLVRSSSRSGSSPELTPLHLAPTTARRRHRLLKGHLLPRLRPWIARRRRQAPCRTGASLLLVPLPLARADPSPPSAVWPQEGALARSLASIFLL